LLVSIKDPVEAYEMMPRVAQMAEECDYETVWLADHFIGEHFQQEQRWVGKLRWQL